MWVGAVFLSLRGIAFGGGIIDVEYTLDWEQDVDKSSAGTTRVTTTKHILDMRYSGFISPVLENEIKLKIEKETRSNDDPRSTTKIFPEISLTQKGSIWNAGAKRTIEDSDEPDTNRKTADSYFVEVFVIPPRATLPDLKVKYTVDEDFESGSTDTSEQGITLSSVYQPMKWLEFKVDYDRTEKDDKLNADSDSKDEKISGTVGIRHFISSQIRVNSEFRTEKATTATLLDTGGTTNQTDERTHTWKNTVAFLPFKDTTIDGSYDFELREDVISGEDSYNKNWKAAVSQRVNIFDFKGDFTRQIDETRHSSDDNEKTEDTWTLEGRANISKYLDFTARYQVTDTREIFLSDPSKNTTSKSVNRNATWTGEITPFWKASATYDKNDTIEKGVTTKIDTNYNIKSTLDFKTIALTLDPSYDITRTEDRQATSPVDTETKDFKFKIAWKVFSTNNMEANVDHTYGRITDSGAGTIERTDDSTGMLEIREPLPGWNMVFDVTRSATDTSEDDLPPDITSTFGLKVDYTHEHLNWNMSYKYDKKNLTDNSETFDVKLGWSAPRWDIVLTYKFDKTFSAELDERYIFGIEFKYTL
jgi:hypothetical protein